MTQRATLLAILLAACGGTQGGLGNPAQATLDESHRLSRRSLPGGAGILGPDDLAFVRTSTGVESIDLAHGRTRSAYDNVGEPIALVSNAQGLLCHAEGEFQWIDLASGEVHRARIDLTPLRRWRIQAAWQSSRRKVLYLRMQGEEITGAVGVACCGGGEPTEPAPATYASLEINFDSGVVQTHPNAYYRELIASSSPSRRQSFGTTLQGRQLVDYAGAGLPAPMNSWLQPAASPLRVLGLERGTHDANELVVYSAEPSGTNSRRTGIQLSISRDSTSAHSALGSASIVGATWSRPPNYRFDIDSSRRSFLIAECPTETEEGTRPCRRGWVVDEETRVHTVPSSLLERDAIFLRRPLMVVGGTVLTLSHTTSQLQPTLWVTVTRIHAHSIEAGGELWSRELSRVERQENLEPVPS